MTDQATKGGLSATRFGVTVGRKALLQDVSVACRPGEFVAFIGPNGAGKTTLLRALAGDLRRHKTQGSVTIEGWPLSTLRPLALAQRRAYLRQATSMTFELSVLEITLMGAAPHHCGVERVSDVELAWEALEATGIASLATRAYPSLSGGEQQRTQLARTLVQLWASPHQHRYLLLDEPTSSLDVARAHDVLGLALGQTRRQERPVGVIAVLHGLDLAAAYADRVYLLRDGAVVAHGPPDRVLTEETVMAVFDFPVRRVTDPITGRPFLVPATQPLTGRSAAQVAAQSPSHPDIPPSPISGVGNPTPKDTYEHASPALRNTDGHQEAPRT